MSIKKKVILLGVALSMLGSITVNAAASSTVNTISQSSSTSQPELKDIKAKGYGVLTNNGCKSSQYSFKVTLSNKGTVLDALTNHSPYIDKDGHARELAYVFKLRDATTGELLSIEDVTWEIWKLKGKRCDYSLFDQLQGKTSGNAFPVNINKKYIQDKINPKHYYNLTLETSYKSKAVIASYPIPGEYTETEIVIYNLINNDKENAVSNIGKISGWYLAK